MLEPPAWRGGPVMSESRARLTISVPPAPEGRQLARGRAEPGRNPLGDGRFIRRSASTSAFRGLGPHGVVGELVPGPIHGNSPGAGGPGWRSTHSCSAMPRVLRGRRRGTPCRRPASTRSTSTTTSPPASATPGRASHPPTARGGCLTSRPAGEVDELAVSLGPAAGSGSGGPVEPRKARAAVRELTVRLQTVLRPGRPAGRLTPRWGSWGVSSPTPAAAGGQRDLVLGNEVLRRGGA